MEAKALIGITVVAIIVVAIVILQIKRRNED